MRPGRTQLLLLTILFALGILAVSTLLLTEAEGKTITVDDDGNGDYLSIQAAVDAADEGDTVQVWAGTYNGNLVVNKTLSLVGNGSGETTIQGDGSDHVVEVSSDQVLIRGFTVQGAVSSYAGVYIYGSYPDNTTNGVNVTNCQLSGNGWGIKLVRGSNASFLRNNCSDGIQGGIKLFQSHENHLEDNNCSSGNQQGIFLSLSHRNTIVNCVCDNNEIGGLALEESHENSIMKSRFTGGNYGISIEEGDRNTVSENNCSLNTRTGNSVGIILDDSGFSILDNNSCSWNSDRGIYLLDSPDNRLDNNSCLSNQGANIYVLQSDRNELFSNNCSSGSFGISFGSTSDCDVIDNRCWFNSLGGIELFGSSSHNTISGNVISRGEKWGVRVAGSNNNLFVFNTARHNDVVGMVFEICEGTTVESCVVSRNGYAGIRLRTGTNDQKILNSTITYNDNGIYARRVENCQLRGNTIMDNRDYGIDNDLGDTINATGNWWGTREGPYHETLNPEGTADNITDYVLFNPWTGKRFSPVFVDDSAPAGGDGTEEKPLNTLTEAIDTVAEGGTIYVWRGVYQENLVVDKTLSIIGNGSEWTTVDGGGAGHALEIRADWVNLTGLSFTNTGSFSAGIAIMDASNVEIIACNASDTNPTYGYGILLSNATNCEIRYSRFMSNQRGALLIGGSSDNSIRDCIFQGNEYGIYLVSSDDNLFRKNTLTNCGKAGVYLGSSSGNELYQNTLSGGRDGIELEQNTGNNSADQNTITDNWNSGVALAGGGNKGFYLIAQNCDWGHGSGPYHPDNNPYGQVNKVSDFVVFDPWVGKEDYFYRYVWAEAEAGGNGSFEAPFKTIQAAIDDAPEGGTVFVWEGLYLENVVVNRTITLEGNGSKETIIDGGRAGVVVNISADHVQLSGLSIFNSSRSAVLIDGDMVELTNCNITGSLEGVAVVNGSEGVSVGNCEFTGFTGLAFNATDNGGEEVDATGNWWGSEFGPYNATENPYGRGDNVAGNVLFDPWTGSDIRHAPNITTDNPGLVIITELDSYLFQPLAEDDDILPYDDELTWTLDSDAPWLEINETSGELSGRPNLTQAGFYYVIVYVRDDSELGDFLSFSILVPNFNTPPRFEPDTPDDTLEDEVFIFQMLAEDDDLGQGDELNWEMSTNAGWLNIGAENGTLWGTPENGDVGSYYVNVTVRDKGGLSDYHNVTLVILNTNDPPVITTTEPPLTVNEDQEYSYQLLATDIDQGDELKWDLETNSDWLELNATTGLLSGTPGNEDVGSYYVNVTVEDLEGTTDFLNFTLTVNNSNDSPSISITSVSEGEELKGTVAVEGAYLDPDPDEEVELYLRIDDGDWQELSTEGRSVEGGWSFDWNTAQYQNGPHQLTVRIFDGEFEETVIVNVTLRNSYDGAKIHLKLETNFAGTSLDLEGTLDVGRNYLPDSQNVTLILDPSGAATSYQLFANSEGEFVTTLNIRELASGSYFIRAEATLPSGTTILGLDSFTVIRPVAIGKVLSGSGVAERPIEGWPLTLGRGDAVLTEDIFEASRPTTLLLDNQSFTSKWGTGGLYLFLSEDTRVGFTLNNGKLVIWVGKGFATFLAEKEPEEEMSRATTEGKLTVSFSSLPELDLAFPGEDYKTVVFMDGAQAPFFFSLDAGSEDVRLICYQGRVLVEEPDNPTVQLEEREQLLGRRSGNLEPQSASYDTVLVQGTVDPRIQVDGNDLVELDFGHILPDFGATNRTLVIFIDQTDFELAVRVYQDKDYSLRAARVQEMERWEYLITTTPSQASKDYFNMSRDWNFSLATTIQEKNFNLSLTRSLGNQSGSFYASELILAEGGQSLNVTGWEWLGVEERFFVSYQLDGEVHILTNGATGTQLKLRYLPPLPEKPKVFPLLCSILLTSFFFLVVVGKGMNVETRREDQK